jgi:hypothetical protein
MPEMQSFNLAPYPNMAGPVWDVTFQTRDEGYVTTLTFDNLCQARSYIRHLRQDRELCCFELELVREYDLVARLAVAR